MARRSTPKPVARPVRVLVVEDHPIMREGILDSLRSVPRLEVVGYAANGREATAKAITLRPDVVVMDVRLPGMDGIQATQCIIASQPATRVVALSVHADRDIVRVMLRAGARGYVTKDCVSGELVKAIQTVAAGGHYLSPQVRTAIRCDVAESPPLSERLTPVEREVLRHFAAGKSAEGIADALDVSVSRVNACRRSIMRKLGFATLSDLGRYASSHLDLTF